MAIGQTCLGKNALAIIIKTHTQKHTHTCTRDGSKETLEYLSFYPANLIDLIPPTKSTIPSKKYVSHQGNQEKIKIYTLHTIVV